MRRLVLLVFALAAVGAVAPAALADEQIVASPPQRYSTPTVTMDQGERLTFRNLDTVGHDVTAKRLDEDNKPLFRTPIINNGEEAFVEGSQYLVAGNYEFFCSVHPNMTGTITVTDAGTPATRPTPGTKPPADKVDPKVSVRITSKRLARVRGAGAILARVSVDEAARVSLRAVARPRAAGPLVTVARGTVKLSAAGVRRVELDLTKAGRRALRGKRRLAVLVSARAVDRAGNRATDVHGRTLR